ncbi:hypothetical protein L1987_60269 [Smallanthus sonchifolius]|uniref:Uncharacterized protein n=1 Tax=Smallanthus sonchifolius TaxID=185202 RepID=A0ACB9D7M4_9ASTR|nr:hypothetical protein L1987_60269 [Smallanthus sonchifolius]
MRLRPDMWHAGIGLHCKHASPFNVYSPLLTPLHVSFYFTISFFLFSSATNVLFASSSFCALISSCLAFLLHRKASKRATEKEKTITVMETVTGGKHATGNRQPSTFRTVSIVVFS